MFGVSLVVQVVGLAAMTLAAAIAREPLPPPESLMLAALVYWVLTIVFSLVQERLEKRMAQSEVRL